MSAVPSWLRQGVLAKILALAVALVALSVLAGLWTSSTVARNMTDKAHQQLADTTTEWVAQDLDSQSRSAAMLALQVAADRVSVAMVVVAMAPEQELLEDEEQRDAGDQRDAYLVDAIASCADHRVRDQRQQRRS